MSDTQFNYIIQFPTGRKFLPSAVWICGLNNRQAVPTDFPGKINVSRLTVKHVMDPSENKSFSRILRNSFESRHFMFWTHRRTPRSGALSSCVCGQISQPLFNIYSLRSATDSLANRRADLYACLIVKTRDSICSAVK